MTGNQYRPRMRPRMHGLGRVIRLPLRRPQGQVFVEHSWTVCLLDGLSAGRGGRSAGFQPAMQRAMVRNKGTSLKTVLQGCVGVGEGASVQWTVFSNQ